MYRRFGTTHRSHLQGSRIYRCFGTTHQSHLQTHQDGTNTLSRNIGKKKITTRPRVISQKSADLTVNTFKHAIAVYSQNHTKGKHTAGKVQTSLHVKVVRYTLLVSTSSQQHKETVSSSIHIQATHTGHVCCKEDATKPPVAAEGILGRSGRGEDKSQARRHPPSWKHKHRKHQLGRAAFTPDADKRPPCPQDHLYSACLQFEFHSLPKDTS
jgi:hypothetical protein